jgi:hypothetical protein
VLANAQITVGQRQATSDASGNFEVTGLSAGAVTVQAQRAGYLAETANVTLSAGTNTLDFALDVQEVYVSAPHAAYLPAGNGPLRAVIILLGGPLTDGFVTGTQIGPSGNPPLEQSLQALGQSLRSLAGSSRVALLGTSTLGLPNNSGSDNTLFTALTSFATLSDHPELVGAPVLLVGFSSGGAEASGLVSRNTGRAIGLLARVPTTLLSITDAAALAVPTFVMQAELDQVANNPAIQGIFLANRSRGGLWSLAVEPGVAHDEASAVANAAMINWITAVLGLRLGAAAGDPLNALTEPSGWLGNQSTLAIASWATYPDDPTVASWLLSQSVATTWQALGTGIAPP